MADYHMKPGDTLLAILKPAATDDAMARAARALEPRVWFPAGRGKVWCILPPGKDRTEQLGGLSTAGCKVVTTKGVWNPAAQKPDTPPLLVIRNVHVSIHLAEVVEAAATGKTRHCFIVDTKAAEPLHYNVEYYGSDWNEEATQRVEKLWRSVWVDMGTTEVPVWKW